MLVTASKTGLLLQCGRPFWPEVQPERDGGGEAATYGTGFHHAIATMLGGPASDAVIDPAAFAHAQSAFRALVAALPDACWDLKGRMVETAFLYSPQTGKARLAELVEADHTYTGQSRGEIGASVDLAFYDPREAHLIVLDHKTGQDPGDPAEHPQLLTLALIIASYLRGKPVKKLTLGFHLAPRETGGSRVVLKSVAPARLTVHRGDLRRAFFEVDRRTLRPGPECQYCPARFDCPTRTSALATLDPQAPLVVWDAERVGRVHQALAMYEDMAKRLKEQIKAWVTANGEATRPDGQTVKLTTRPFSQLSMASIRRALPKEEAEALIDELGAKGCIEQGDRLELRSVKGKPQ